MTKERKKFLVNDFAKAVDDMKKTKFNGTYYWHLNTDDDDRYWAIVLGWSGGYEPDENNDCMDGEYQLCAKIAYQPYNSFMQCDYDVDWTMPYNEETGDVDDTEIAVYSGSELEYVIDWLLNCYSYYED